MMGKHRPSPHYLFSVLLCLLSNTTFLHVSFLHLLAYDIPGVDAQRYTRDWEFRVTNGVSEPWWAPTPSDTYRRVKRPSSTVWLEYNCRYMAGICQNAVGYINSQDNQNRPNPTAFAFDFNKDRKDWRRDRESCPSNWIDRHSCPEVAGVPAGNLAQPLSYRYIIDQGSGSFWPFTAVEPGEKRTLQHLRDPNGGILELSRLSYTCDEWPAAAFIQGGTGAFTRCAAFRCGAGVQAEQQFQADSHNYLRQTLVYAFDGQTPALDLTNDVVMFFFRTTNLDNDTPAKIYSYDANGVATEDRVPFAKRQNTDEMSYIEWMNWADSVLMEDLVANYSGVQQVHLFANRSVPTGFASIPILGEGWQNQFDQFDPLDDDTFLGPTRRRTIGQLGQAEIDLQNATSFDLADDVPILPERRKESSWGNVKEKSQKLVYRDTLLSNDSDPTTTPLLKNSTQSDLEEAIKIVEDAIAESSRLNRARYENMARNQYSLRPGTAVGGRGRVRRRNKKARKGAASLDSRDDAGPSPLFDITPEIAAAAALVAEADAVGLIGSDGTLMLNKTTPQKRVEKPKVSPRAGSFWMESIERKGTVPWGDDPSYKVFRNVMDYGAKGDGATDDSAAIQKAMSDGNRCGEKCNGSTLKNAIVYFPPGTYLVSKTIKLPFGTQVIGDANSRPTILASSRFIGLGVLSTDEYTGGGKGPDGLDQEYYINTGNFYRQIRNLIIDITATRSTQEVAGIHYQVAQATSTQNIDIIAKSGTSQRGMFSENGSGGQLSDINFKNGNFCFYGGNQQFTAQRLNFDGCNTAVQIIWDWGWVWKSINIKNVDVGFRLVPEEDSNTSSKRKRDGGEVNQAGNIGSASFIDSSFSDVGTAAIVIAPLDESPGTGSTGLVLENVQLSNVGAAVKDTSGKTLLDGGSKTVEQWVTGPIYAAGEDRSYSMGGDAPKYRREPSLLDGSGKYFERARPQYEGNSASDFVHLKDLGAAGDGTTDDTAAVQNALNANIGKIIFVDAGSYILKGTVTIPPGTKLVGETWSQFVASGDYFSDANNPKVMLKVGNAGDVGDVEMQDLLFTTKGPTPGAILVEWNIKARSPGSAGLWDCHVRIGGATGTSLDPASCPAITSGTNSDCEGASLMMHLTSQASGYFENMWLWTADHMIDDPLLDDASNNMEQTSIYVARGFLIESRSATWLYGTASEHSVYYQYSFNRASNLFVGMLQTESPYYQPTPNPPTPFDGVVQQMNGDPDYVCGTGDFDGCDSSWAVIMRGSDNIYVAGAGLYSWFSTYTQECIDEHACQKALMLLENNRANIRLQHLITIGAKYSLIQDGKGILATDNLNVDTHPKWSQITIFDVVPGNGDDLHISPEDATVIPMPHTTVPPKSTFTIDEGAATDLVSLPYDGDQNDVPGPGHEDCQSCSFFRLITSTCCGIGGSLGNPIVIPTGVPVPVPIQLPPGFVPNQDITGEDGVTYPKDEPLPAGVTIPTGTVFPDEPFVIPPGQPLADGEDGNDGGNMIWIDPEIWDEDDPTIWCDQLPCTIQFPPWDLATSTIDYPIVTIKNDTFTTTITRSAITVTEWVFKPYTVTRPPTTVPPGPPPSTTPTSSSTSDVIVVIWPPPPFDTTTTWPPITYTGQDGKTTKTRPSTPTHPPPPPPFPPGPPPPPGGHWPSISITVSKGRPKPTVHPCGFPALQCPGSNPDPDGPGGSSGPPDDPDDPDEPEEPTCGNQTPEPDPTDVPTTPPADPTPDPTPTPVYDHADPSKNEKTCYNSGQTSNNERMQNAAVSFCNYLRNFGPVLGPGSMVPWKASFDGSPSMHIDLSFEVFDGCEWDYDYFECVRYMQVGIDSCDCSTLDKKQGGYVTNNCIRARIDPQTGT